MLQLPLLNHQIKIQVTGGQARVFDPVRKKWLVLTPEEHVRQLLLHHLIHVQQYPAPLISVEKKLVVAQRSRRFDIVVYNRQTHRPWMLVECKSPEVPLTDAALYQLLDYHNQLQCRFWLVSNGHQHFCADTQDTGNIRWINALPAYEL